jgi:hypothetical protein
MAVAYDSWKEGPEMKVKRLHPLPRPIGRTKRTVALPMAATQAPVQGWFNATTAAWAGVAAACFIAVIGWQGQRESALQAEYHAIQPFIAQATQQNQKLAKFLHLCREPISSNLWEATELGEDPSITFEKIPQEKLPLQVMPAIRAIAWNAATLASVRRQMETARKEPDLRPLVCKFTNDLLTDQVSHLEEAVRTLRQ